MPIEPGELSAREGRALAMLASGIRVLEPPRPNEFLVPSASGSGAYHVHTPKDSEDFERCDCPDFDQRFAPCKHILVVRHWIQASRKAEGETLFPPPPRRTRPHAKEYTQAQVEEIRLLPILLRELCKGVAEPERDPHKAGRPPIPLRDQLFCAVQKVHSGFSARRSSGHRSVAAAQGHIAAAPYFDVSSKILCREGTTSILLDLIARSALPFRAIEDRCAIDSTGFRTTQFHYYRNEKYTPTRKNQWLKAHALIGVNSHAVLAVEITGGEAGDSPRFGLLLERAKKAGFELKEVLADKAYNSRANFDLATEFGMDAFIPFKSNQTGQSKGSPTYHKMFLFFTYHREKFEAHYRKRGQIEVAFGAIKQKIGETLSSRKFTAQVNELLAKLVVHNLTMLIQAMYGIGILPDFLPPPVTPSAAADRQTLATAEPLLSFNPPLEQSPVVFSTPAA